jgi:hypothetical protein
MVQRMRHSQSNANHLDSTREPERNRWADRNLLGDSQRFDFAELPVAKGYHAYQWGHFSQLHHTRDYGLR